MIMENRVRFQCTLLDGVHAVITFDENHPVDNWDFDRAGMCFPAHILWVAGQKFIITEEYSQELQERLPHMTSQDALILI